MREIYTIIHIKKKSKVIKKIPDFDILYEDPDELSINLKKKLESGGYTNIEMVKHEAIDDVIPEYIDFKLNGKTLVSIFKPIACHSYNVIEIKSKKIRIATIETILSFYLAFLFMKSDYKNNRLLCMSYYLYRMMRRRKPDITGIFKRFNINCIGKQLTFERMRAEKAIKYKELRKRRHSPEFEWWFLRYIPHIIHEYKSFEKNTRRKKRKKRKKTRRTKKSK